MSYKTFNFSHKKLQALKEKGRYIDTKKPHTTVSCRLVFRVGANVKSWRLEYRKKGERTKVVTLGRFPDLGLAAARDLASEKMVEIAKGSDPAAEKKAYREAETVSWLWERYVEAAEAKAKKKSEKTWTEENRYWNNDIKPALGKKKVVDVRPMDCATVLNRKAAKAPVAANRLYGVMKAMFDVAYQLEIIDAHPMGRLSPPGGEEPPRKRYLSYDEIKILWPMFEILTPNPRDILKLGLLTCARPGEVQSMMWKDVDLDAAEWHIKDSKTDEELVVPLSRQAVEILEARKRTSVFIFPSSYNRCKTGHTTSLKESRKKLREKSGITGWTSHDLRRTSRTMLSRLQVPVHIRERCLNHKIQGVEGVYDMYDFLPERREALQKLADEIENIVSGNVTSGNIHNVEELKEKAS